MVCAGTRNLIDMLRIRSVLVLAMVRTSKWIYCLLFLIPISCVVYEYCFFPCLP